MTPEQEDRHTQMMNAAMAYADAYCTLQCDGEECHQREYQQALRDMREIFAQSLRNPVANQAETSGSPLRAAALLALGLLWMTERQSDKVHRAYTTLRDALGGKEALREGIQAAMDAGHEADHPHGADWWAGKKEAADGVRDTTNDQPKEPK